MTQNIQRPNDLSEAKRLLLERLLRGEMPKVAPQFAVSSASSRTAQERTPLSYAQQQLWLLAQLIPDVPVYNECVTVHLPGPLNVAVLERSFNEILRRHEAWRTRFPLHNGEPVQIVQPSLTFTLPVTDLRHLPPTEREAEALRLAKADALLPFDLTNGPLLRPLLIRLDDEDHRLFLTLHHIIFDGVSIYQVFLPELCAIYDAFLHGQFSTLATLPTQYPDYALWQRDRLQGSMLAEQLAYWKQQLAAAPALLALPTDRPRPPRASFSGAVYQQPLSDELTHALRGLSRREGVTLYTTLLAAFNTLLYRYSGQDDILVGTASAGRSRAEFQQLLGVFINMLVLRTRITGDLSFRELLRSTQDMTRAAQAHQDIPFEMLVKELQPERGAGQNPLFQVLLMLEPPVPSHPSGWTITHMEVETGTSKFDLSLILEDRPEGLVGRFEYSSDLFDAATIERMAGHWQTLLESIVANPERRVNDFPLLTPSEQQHIVVQWNDNATNDIAAACLHQLIEAQVERTPDATALVCGSQRLSYRQLNEKANQLARHLRTLGVGPESLVGVCVERSLEMVIALLGILKAGGAYVPLDPAYPRERIAFMLQDSNAAVLLTQQKLVARLPQHSARVLCLDSDWESIARNAQTNLINETGQGQATAPTCLAYVIYTSGSTGKPKGVAIEHRSVVAFARWALSVFTSEDLAGVLASTSICFDLSVFELFVTLCGGGSAIIVENILRLPELLSGTSVTLLNTVPSAMAELLRTYRLPASVRVVNLAGEALPRSLAQRIYEEPGVQRVYNLYGPSEDTTYSTYTLVERDAPLITIGRPIANTQAYILNAALQPQPVGIAGELYLGGDGLARGYLHRPELTAERFVHNPFSQQPDARMYKTGDLARYLPDGEIEFLGRIDHQVKIRGFRVELGEIEETIKQYSGVRETIVVAREDTPGDKRLVAYVVAQPGQSLALNALRKHLQDGLPGYMVPSAFVPLDALPLTPNGKVDRKALPAPIYSTISAQPTTRDEQESFTAPLMTIHHQLTHIWEELLGVQPIGIKDNFFDLGGHSLLAARLLSEVERISGKKLPLTTFFAGATIEHLANAILGDEETRSRAPTVAIQASGTRRPFFFLHGDWIGGGFYCLELARSLGNDQPFYVMEPYKFAGLPVPPTLKEVAAEHIASMRAVQPEGPYAFGGFCNGGLIAYEMARQLQAAGQEVALLLLVDPATPTPHRKVREYITRFGGKLHLSKSAQVDWFLRYLYMKMPHFRKRFKGSEHLTDIEEIELGREGEIQRSWREKLMVIPPRVRVLRQQWSGIYRWVAAGYVPGPYTGKATFLWSSDKFSVFVRYKHVAKNADIQVVPGTHMGWKTDNLAILSAKMRDYLNEAQTEKQQKEEL